MLRRIVLAAVVLAAIGFAVFWWLTIPAVIASNALPAYTPNPANGLTVFNAGGCSSCHAVPNQPDRTRLGGGLAIPSPFGTFYAPNISPDPNDGIGRWSEADFVRAMREGRRPVDHADLRHLVGHGARVMLDEAFRMTGAPANPVIRVSCAQGLASTGGRGRTAG